MCFFVSTAEQSNLEQFQEKIGYKFDDVGLLYEALSHSSFANEKKGRHSNERLEFLGDSVLSIVVSNYIFHHEQKMPEGQLSKLRASLVCEKALFEFAQQIDLGQHIMLGKGEEVSGGRNRPSIISDAFEAVIAAIYLDGGMEAASKHILRFMPKNLHGRGNVSFRDYKTILQEIVQKNPEERVEYVLVDESGPAHDKKFTINVMLNSNVIGTGEGSSKKSAEQQAAKEALALMGHTYE